ncbi:MAG: zinc ribbon domain-containing protein [Chloroflexi bacterium]|nr:zinc ribbon domain-containing protein [Chloroflexota bacterium]
MPIYEYICLDCRRKVSIFYRTLTLAEAADPSCPRCQGKRLHRVISRVAMLRSEESRLEALADPSMLAGLEEEDPRALGRMMRQMSAELGEEMDDPELNEIVDRLESGQSPEEIEKSMPEIAGDMPAPGMDE